MIVFIFIIINQNYLFYNNVYKIKLYFKNNNFNLAEISIYKKL